MSSKTLKIIPLGGAGEIGKNMTVLEYDHKAIIVDAGLMFPESDMLGIDYIIPDFSYLVERDDLEVLAILLTHGHEDHTGAIVHVLEYFQVPIYATRLTAGLLDVKLRQAKLNQQTTFTSSRRATRSTSGLSRSRRITSRTASRTASASGSTPRPGWSSTPATSSSITPRPMAGRPISPSWPSSASAACWPC